MIVKFHARGVGRGSGPVEYLLGEKYDREGATLDRGDPSEVQALIDSSPYAKKYTSGVLSFAESDLGRATKDRIMSSFEKTLLPGLSADQYSCLWVEHRDKGRLELNFVIPNVELLTGKRLQPYYDRADQPRVNAWKVITNAHFKLHDPDDPINKRELVTPRNLPEKKNESAQAITDGLLSLASSGEISSRQDIVQTLESSGFTIARQTSKSISISDPEGGRNIRLKGAIYEQSFKFGAGLQEEIEAASARYRAESEERVREAREIHRRGVEIKRAENQKRHRRPDREHGGVRHEVMALDSTEHSLGIRSFGGGDLLAREHNQRELTDHQRAERDHQAAGGERRQNSDEPLRDGRPTLRETRSRGGEVSGRVGDGRRMDDTRGVLNDDGIRTAAIERIREFAAATREATQRLCDGLQRISSDVRDYLQGERSPSEASRRLELSSKLLERTAPEIEETIKQQSKMSKGRSLDRGDRGFSL